MAPDVDNPRRPTPMESPWRHAKKKAKLVDFHFHDLRHTYASYLAMSGASLRVIADLLGHRNIQQTMVYSYLLPSHTKGVVEQMMGTFLADDASTPAPAVPLPEANPLTPATLRAAILALLRAHPAGLHVEAIRRRLNLSNDIRPTVLAMARVGVLCRVSPRVFAAGKEG